MLNVAARDGGVEETNKKVAAPERRRTFGRLWVRTEIDTYQANA